MIASFSAGSSSVFSQKDQKNNDLLSINDQIRTKNRTGNSGDGLLDDYEDINSQSSEFIDTRHNSKEIASPLLIQKQRKTQNILKSTTSLSANNTEGKGESNNQDYNLEENPIDSGNIQISQNLERRGEQDLRLQKQDSDNLHNSKYQNQSKNRAISIVTNESAKPMLLVKKEQMAKLMKQSTSQKKNNLINLDIFKPQNQMETEMKIISDKMRIQKTKQQMKEELQAQYEIAQLNNLSYGYENPKLIKFQNKDKYKILLNKIDNLLLKCESDEYEFMREKLFLIQNDMQFTYKDLKIKRDQKNLQLYLYGIQKQVNEINKQLSDEI